MLSSHSPLVIRTRIAKAAPVLEPRLEARLKRVKVIILIIECLELYNSGSPSYLDHNTFLPQCCVIVMLYTDLT